MTIDINQFWTLLEKSRLVELPKIQTLINRFQEKFDDPAGPQITTQQVANWMVKQKLLTGYQARILLAGQHGPMRYGGYVIQDKNDDSGKSGSEGSFQAIHQKTAFPVNLEFMAGTEPAHLDAWQKIEPVSESLTKIQSPFLVRVYETVALPNHRFVVSEASIGKSLDSMLPRKGRLPWKDACKIMAQVAIGLQELHDHGIVHNAISPLAIWIGNGSKAKLQMKLIPDSKVPSASTETPSADSNPDKENRFDFLAPEVSDSPTKTTSKSDLYSIGCALYRMISGRPVFPATSDQEKIKAHQTSAAKDLSKYKIPPKLQRLITKLLAKEPDSRPENAKTVGGLLAEIAEAPDVLSTPHEFPTGQAAYIESLTAWQQLNNGPPKIADPVAVVPDQLERTTSAEANANAIERAKAKAKQSKWKSLTAVLAALAILSAIIGSVAYMASRKPIVVKKVEPETLKEPEQTPAPVVKETIDYSKISLVQDLIDDDRETLWEAPTTGMPVDFSFVPAAPKLLFVFRPSEIWAQSEGKRLLKSLGPSLTAQISKWLETTGLEFEDIERLIISFHSIGGDTYSPFFVVDLTQPTTPENLEIAWRNPAKIETEDGDTIYEANDANGFFITRSNTDDSNTDDSKTDDSKTDDSNAEESNTRFVYGNTELVREVIESGGANVLSGSLNKLAKWSDRSRHFTGMFLRQSLFNEQGQDFMAGQMAGFNRQLDLFLQDEIRGGLFSLHLDEGTYLEFIFDQTVDLKSKDLKTSLETRLRDQRDRLTRLVLNIPQNAYWDNVRVKYDNMLSDVYRSLRWDVEFQTVIGNCWLPPVAAHNLVAASELLTAFAQSGADPVAAASTKKVPATIEELLAAKRNLEVSTNPDLNLLLKGIRDEIIDDYGQLPFPFDFQLMGNDLQKDGITQNQRPGDFKLNEASLAEILTEIMVRCNPSKDISGPEDPNCKLVWVVGPAPENPDQQVILITTRDGAAKLNLSLPEEFQIQE